MEKLTREECNHITENTKNKEEFLEFSDDFVLRSSCHNFSPYYKEGYLEKKCSNSWCGYAKRWFLLKNKKLYYFKTKESLRPSGVLDLELIHMNINYDHGVNRKRNADDCFLCNIRKFLYTNNISDAFPHFGYCIESRMYKNESLLILNPQNTKVKFYLRGNDKDICEWYSLLSNSMINKKITTQPKFIFSENNFWKIDRISVDVFESIADTGDIVLFRSNVVSAKLQRMLTRGEYDHIGMILRNDKNNLFLLEALSNMGIVLTPWDLFRKNRWNEAYARIALRRLTWDNSEENLRNLLNFLKNTIGKKYNLKIINFITPKSAGTDSYFCSELIGECWKKYVYKMDNIRNIKNKNSLPLLGNFSEKFEEKIKLQSGCQLNNELCIDFSL
ncbi:PH domain-containing protein [Plasmodium brasilianum]|uniref:PH domain-containing protein n=1 Tax=Plasmodium brasilianum TaxID=5824 RepID=A0ACB9Y754_PLABR|nr:PH domain-containing protein [Plasmodium brasilianum]